MRADDPTELVPAGPSVREAPELAAELLGRYRSHRPVRGVGVTDLIDPRPAYWRVVSPIPPTPEQFARLRAGQSLHETLGRRLGPAATREFRVRRDGIVGRIDVLDGRPIELKSTDSPPREGEDLRASRPSYLEQLAMYAALVDRTDGRLVIVRAGAPGPSPVGVWDLRLRDPVAVRAEMNARAAALRTARDRHDPSGLPRCAWFDRGCPYRRASACDCSGQEVPLSPAILDAVESPLPNPSEGQRIADLLDQPTPPATEVARFRELAYPRRAFFDSSAEEATPPGVPEAGEPDETWSALHAILEDGPAGEYELRHAASGTPEEPVECFRSEPCLVKSTRAVRPIPAASLAADRPHYLLELALRCGGLGVSAGWLILGLERVPSEGEWIRVQRVEFREPSRLTDLVGRRAAQLTDARRRGDAAGLPRCPAWMFEGCPHRGVCGCGPRTAPGGE
ncbi:MAG: hypothetical protein L3K05_04635 [Thermoplasmata archaeon]|nr:hypothetical protein [Thermoplasmata archaeon]